MEIGDLIATRSDSFVGRAIRLGEKVKDTGSLWRGLRAPATTDSHWNHIAVYVGDGQIVEALGKGLTLSPLTKYSEYLHLPMPAGPKDKRLRAAALLFAMDELKRKRKYGWLSIASIFFQLVTPFKFSVSYGGAVICSAFGAMVWEHAGIIIPVNDDKCTMPSELIKMVVK